MFIRFTKRSPEKHTLTCFRDDGSTTWVAEDAYFVWHDLIHYAVETVLNYQQAFYGMLASGTNIEDFGKIDPATGAKLAISREADYAEHIVGILQTEVWGSATSETFADLLQAAYTARSLPPPIVTPEQHNALCQRITELHNRWHSLPVGDSLELKFS